ncbi:MAG: Y4bD/Y4pK family protein [Acidimicrobiia bacterium]|nr:Y4bD/Y4pK family protein [Acidimicrobiia bacterium]
MTHPFHPWSGAEFVLVGVRQTWGESRVFFFADDGTQKSLPTGWTDAFDPDPFVVVAAGRSPFKVVDLLELAELVGDVSMEDGDDDV